MARVTYGVARRKKRKKVLKRAKGFRGGRHALYKTAKETLLKGDMYAFRDRRVKKRNFRKLWIERINAACRALGMSYSRFMDGLNKAGIDLNRKMLSELAIHDPEGFKGLVETAKAAISN